MRRPIILNNNLLITHRSKHLIYKILVLYNIVRLRNTRVNVSCKYQYRPITQYYIYQQYLSVLSLWPIEF